ncbi:MAG: glycogen/starch synthase, partial [Endomicrobium sp.]|nr:glycogen/starch synthase [Endomicrobium sp.]
MNIVMIASECVPFIKAGRLADVARTLPKYLKKLGYDVRIILPKYADLDGKQYNIKTLPYRLLVKVVQDTESFRIKYCLTEDNIYVYFIENMCFFSRPGIYGNNGQDYSDNGEHYISALESVKTLIF